MTQSTRIPASCLLLCGLLAWIGNNARIEAEATRQDDKVTQDLQKALRIEKVTIDASAVKLAGTVFIPRATSGKRAPAVLLIGGSNFTGRGAISAALAPVKALRELSIALAETGRVVLTYESRCMGASECIKNSTPHEYAEDAIAALLFLQNRPEVDSARVVVMGHDEGGTFAAGVAANTLKLKAKVSGVILIAAPGRTYGKVLRDQAQRRLKQAGKSESEVKEYLEKFDQLASSLSSGNVDPQIRKNLSQDPLFELLMNNQQYFVHIFVNDPLQLIRGVETPVLIVQGEKDAHMTQRDAKYLEEALSRQFHPDTTLRLLPEMDHWMRVRKTASAFEDEETASGPIDPALIAVLNEWITRKTK